MLTFDRVEQWLITRSSSLLKSYGGAQNRGSSEESGQPFPCLFYIYKFACHVFYEAVYSNFLFS